MRFSPTIKAVQAPSAPTKEVEGGYEMTIEIIENHVHDRYADNGESADGKGYSRNHPLRTTTTAVFVEADVKTWEELEIVAMRSVPAKPGTSIGVHNTGSGDGTVRKHGGWVFARVGDRIWRVTNCGDIPAGKIRRWSSGIHECQVMGA